MKTRIWIIHSHSFWRDIDIFDADWIDIFKLCWIKEKSKPATKYLEKEVIRYGGISVNQLAEALAGI